MLPVSITQLKSRDDLEKKNEGKWTGMVEIRTRKKFLALSKACMAVF